MKGKLIVKSDKLAEEILSLRDRHYTWEQIAKVIGKDKRFVQSVLPYARKKRLKAALTE